MSNNPSTLEEQAPSTPRRMGLLAARINRRWNWLKTMLLRRGRITIGLGNFSRTSHRNSRTISSTSSSRIYSVSAKERDF